MLKTRQKTCHFLPLFEVRDGHRGREFCTVCQAGTRGSELGYAGSGDSQKNVANTRGKVAQLNSAVVHYLLLLPLLPRRGTVRSWFWQG
jgi:hypothetical protein